MSGQRAGARPADSGDESVPSRILLVEDSLEIVQMVVALLTSGDGFRVTTAQDGIRGARLAQAERWDLLITDLNLPGKEGLDLIREVRAARSSLPILAITGYTRPHYFATALENGANAVLSKPLERDEFLSTVQRLTEREQSRDTGEDRPDESREGGVLAIGAYPGDVEVGAGGILLGHSGRGQPVTIAVISGAGEDGSGAPGRRVAERAAAAVPAGFRIMSESGNPLLSDPPGPVSEWVNALVGELRPRTLYIPSAQESESGRRTLHRLIEGAAAEGVDTVLAYQSPTASVDFRPRLFVNIGDRVDDKVALLAHYLAASDRPELSEEFTRVQARYWGRFARNRWVEPLEAVRGAGWSAPRT